MYGNIVVEKEAVVTTAARVSAPAASTRFKMPLQGAMAAGAARARLAWWLPAIAGLSKHEEKKSSPSEEQIKKALDGNLSRCTGYRPILDACKELHLFTKAKVDRGGGTDMCRMSCIVLCRGWQGCGGSGPAQLHLERTRTVQGSSSK
ncbi:g5218 [Coccomyxa viridis]|uniref:G5218 protein n=1 Tax=Coccomyxa viridis TaxID=1274662 RepID=A0ABP1FUU7_9CHLO